MKKRIAIGIVAAAGVVGAVVLLISVLVPRAVVVASPDSGEVVETLVVTGEVASPERPAATAAVSAEVESVAVEPGDKVSAGELLVRLDDSEARQQWNEARAAVEEARAGFRGVADRGEEAAHQDLRRAEVAVEGARGEYERARRLYDDGVGTRQAVEEADRVVEQAEADVATARAALEDTRREGSEFDRAAAGVATARARAEAARIRLANHDIRAPVDGTVLSRRVNSGDVVQPGSVVIELQPEGPAEIRIRPDERELATVQPGQTALVVVDAYPDRPFEATVHRVEPVVDVERGTAEVLLRVDGRREFLVMGMTATVDVELARRKDTLTLPRAAVRQPDDDPWVLGIEDRRAVRTDVELGLEGDRVVEIVDGVESDQLIVVEPDVEPGDRIRPGEWYDADEAVDRDPGEDFEVPGPPAALRGE